MLTVVSVSSPSSLPGHGSGAPGSLLQTPTGCSNSCSAVYFSLFFSYLSRFFFSFFGFFVVVFLKNLGCRATTGKGEGVQFLAATYGKVD